MSGELFVEDSLVRPPRIEKEVSFVFARASLQGSVRVGETKKTMAI